MALIVWNARGICSTERQSELKKICDENSVEIFGVLETKTKRERRLMKQRKEWVQNGVSYGMKEVREGTPYEWVGKNNNGV